VKRCGWVLVGCLLLVLGEAQAARTIDPLPPKPRSVYALLIGYPEGPKESGLSTLARAESDVVMMSAFLGTLAPEAIYAHVANPALAMTLAMGGKVHVSPPTFSEVEKSVDALVDLLDKDPAADVYVYYAGHGRRRRINERVQTDLFLMPSGKGDGHDGILGSRLLQEKILKPLSEQSATRVHLVIDACQSYFVLEARQGSTEQVLRVRKSAPPVGPSMVGRFVERYERVGALLATNGSQVTYEDPAIGGLFSYAVRSAAIGMADLNGDGRVTYRELDASLPLILGERAGGGPPGLLAPNGDLDTPFVDYRGRSVVAVEFAPVQATRYELTHVPSYQDYAVLYPGANAPVVAWLPAGQEFVTAERRSPEGPSDWFEFTAATARFEALRQVSTAVDIGARGETLYRGILPRPLGASKLVAVEPPEWGWQPQTYVALGAGAVVGTSLVNVAHTRNQQMGGIEISGVFGEGRHQGTARLGWSRFDLDVQPSDGEWVPATVDALRVGVAYGFVLAEHSLFEVTAGPYLGGGGLQFERQMQEQGAGRGVGLLLEAGGEMSLRLFVDSGRLALRTDLRMGAQNVSSSQEPVGTGSATDLVVTGTIGLEYEFVAQ
jgi:hypothetical protein